MYASLGEDHPYRMHRLTRDVCATQRAASRPFDGSLRKITMVSESWLAARRYEPDGTMAKLRGVFPSVGTSWMGDNFPLRMSIENTAMEQASSAGRTPVAQTAGVAVCG